MRGQSKDFFAGVGSALFAVAVFVFCVAADPGLNTWLAKTRGASDTGGSTNKFHYVPLLNANGVLDSSFVPGVRVTREIPSGTLNSTNMLFRIAFPPVTGSEEVFLNGLLQDVGSTNDYTISVTNITFTTPPILGDKIRVNYTK